MNTYETYIQRCLQLAKMGEYYVAPNPMVGAVLVDKNGQVLAEGWHTACGKPHAEVECFRQLEKQNISADLHEATLFVNLEPCSHYGKTPPCADLIISKGVGKVVIGCLDPNPEVAGKGAKKLREAGIEVESGILEYACRELNKRFLCFHEKHRPYVILKWAQSADGFLGRNGERTIISTPYTKQLVHKMRAENMAILIGSGTALTDNPKLLNTHWEGRNPIRVLLDRRGRVKSGNNIFSKDAETIVLYEHTEWQEVLKQLAALDIHSVLVEGGATLLQHILDSGIYDEIHIEVNPTLYLDDGVKAPLVTLPALPPEEADGNLLYTVIR